MWDAVFDCADGGSRRLWSFGGWVGDERPGQARPWQKAWDYIQPWDEERFGDVILDPEERRRWALFFRIGGGLPYMWRELAAPMRGFLTDLLELQTGDRVLVIGEALEPCGFIDDVRRGIGPGGEIRAFEIIEEARRQVLAGRRGANGKLGTWRFTYTDDVPDEYFDCVYVPQGVQHSEDWRVTAPELLRVMRRDRRIVLAEIGFGPLYRNRMKADLHIWATNDRMQAALNRPNEDLSYYSPEQLTAAFDGLVTDPQTLEWKGLEMFWGRKA